MPNCPGIWGWIIALLFDCVYFFSAEIRVFSLFNSQYWKNGRLQEFSKWNTFRHEAEAFSPTCVHLKYSVTMNNGQTWAGIDFEKPLENKNHKSQSVRLLATFHFTQPPLWNWACNVLLFIADFMDAYILKRGRIHSECGVRWGRIIGWILAFSRNHFGFAEILSNLFRFRPSIR